MNPIQGLVSNAVFQYWPTGCIALPSGIIERSMPIPLNMETSADVSPCAGSPTCKQPNVLAFIKWENISWYKVTPDFHIKRLHSVKLCKADTLPWQCNTPVRQTPRRCAVVEVHSSSIFQRLRFHDTLIDVTQTDLWSSSPPPQRRNWWMTACAVSRSRCFMWNLWEKQVSDLNRFNCCRLLCYMLGYGIR